jgi:hypothetical protein
MDIPLGQCGHFGQVGLLKSCIFFCRGGHIQICSFGWVYYFVTSIDDFSWFTKVYFMQCSQIFRFIKHLLRRKLEKTKKNSFK